MTNQPSRRCSGLVTVPLPAADAMKLFTPEGERLWAPGWDPSYPDPERTEGVGAVFVTEHGGRRTTWVMTERSSDAVAYARVAANATAGTVEVRVVDASPTRTTVRVTYDLTALSAGAVAELTRFAENYEHEMAEWTQQIAELLNPGR